MKLPQQLLYLVLIWVLSTSCSSPETITEEKLLAEGRQPQISVAKDGLVRVVYGKDDNIFFTTSSDNGKSFSEPVIVGKIQGLLLGMSMGPQIASSANYTVLTAIDKKGNIHSFSQKHGTDKWVKAADVNDVAGVAAEGLMSLASNDNNTFYAVWLDVRGNKKNKIALATTTGAAENWTANRILYESPDSTVCECCKPSIAVNDAQVNLMFRNWLNGSRDFYVTSSDDAGKTFAAPVKVGKGTWKVDGCPMDGGGLALDTDNNVLTAWQRDGKIYYAQPDSTEILVGAGRNCRLSGGKNPVVSWKDGKELKVKFIASGEGQTIGNGSYIETAEMPDHATLCVWEKEGELYFKRI